MTGGGRGAAAALDRSLARLADGLAAAIRPRIGLWDAVAEGPSDPGHYGQLSAALALFHCHGPDSAWTVPARIWLETPSDRLGHAPFNRLLLLLLGRSLVGADPSAGLWPDRLAAARGRCPLRRRYPSNNWALLATTCRLLEARGTGARERALGHFLRVLARWQTPAGGFIDFPWRPTRGGGATPLAYHHKALFLAALAWHETGDSRLERRVGKMLAWSGLCWDRAGYAGGFGRSTHALFGDACLLAALVLLGVLDERRGGTPEELLLRGVLARWEEVRRPDGLIALNPAGADEAQPGWDEYMRLSVYNAWAGAILAWARAQDRRVGPVTPMVVAADPHAGLLRLEGGGATVLVATRGQPPQAYSARDAELRYAGGLPFHLSDGAAPLLPPAARVPVRRLGRDPARAGWVPLLASGNWLYALTDFESVTVRTEGGLTTIELEGRPRAVFRPPPPHWGSRLVRGLDWRVLGGMIGRRAALRRPVLAGVIGRVRLMIEPAAPRITRRVELTRAAGASPVRYLNPAGHATAGPPPGRVIRRSSGGSGEGEVLIEASRLIEAPLEAAVLGGSGWSLPAEDLPFGPTAFTVTLDWD